MKTINKKASAKETLESGITFKDSKDLQEEYEFIKDLIYNTTDEKIQLMIKQDSAIHENSRKIKIKF